MENIYLIIVGILFFLAVSDLIVGVSNDAVNFLNSAIGSKAAPLRIIFIVAAAGVLAGATFSNGMMEVARKGIFNPSSFYFTEIMIIFLAVMISDVVLLDLFNTFGLPTSTTVSIVFELLGAAVGIAILKISSSSGDFSEMAQYINSSKALAIISGILLSVVVAFSIGAIVMWLSRLLFSFNYNQSIKYFGGIFGGLAVTAITYFILIKGLKGSVYSEQIISSLSLQEWTDFLGRQNFNGFASLIKSLNTFEPGSELANWGITLKQYDKTNYQLGVDIFKTWANQNFSQGITIPLSLVHYVKYNLLKIIVFSFIGFSGLIQFLHSFFKVNILKIIVIIGTFALAMAFAGNDLVNFIGVPLAGLSSYKELISSGSSPDGLVMSALNGPVKTPTIYLLIAGVIMVITLWLSKKARSVVKTTLNLSDQENTQERFESIGLARAIVRNSIIVGKMFDSVVPSNVKNWVGKRFDTSYYAATSNKEQGISFDLVRASVNLLVASILIAFGTSLKLPLSTTYVTFMVAMGTSLADGAWGRESAVYRITGVIAVIGGWFLTAIIAFAMAFIVALILSKTGIWGIVGLSLIAGLVVFRTHAIHKKKMEKENKEEQDALLDYNAEDDGFLDRWSKSIASLLMASAKNYEFTIDSLVGEKRKPLKQALKTTTMLNDESKKMKKNIPNIIKELSEESFDNGHCFVEVLEHTREAMHSLYYISLPAYTHVDNNHKPLTTAQNDSLSSLAPDIYDYLEKLGKSITENDFRQSENMIESSVVLTENINKIRKKHLKLIKKEVSNTRSNLLFLDILNESRNLVLHANNTYKSFRDLASINKQKHMNDIL